MCPQNSGQEQDNERLSPQMSRGGRPVEGIEKMSRLVKCRIEPYLDEEFKYACRLAGISKSEGMREGIILFIRKVAQR